MSGEVKQRMFGGGSQRDDKLEGDALLKKEIAGVYKKADTEKSKFFAESFAKKKSHSPEDSGKSYDTSTELKNSSSSEQVDRRAAWNEFGGRKFSDEKHGPFVDSRSQAGRGKFDSAGSGAEGSKHAPGRMHNDKSGSMNRQGYENKFKSAERSSGSAVMGNRNRPQSDIQSFAKGYVFESRKPEFRRPTHEDIRETSAMSGNAILESIQAQRIAPTSNEAARIIKDLSVHVAEKIIATYEALNAKQEVRITLQNEFLRDTELVVTKDGKFLEVKFLTGSEESENILNYRGGELRTQLMEKLSDINRVEITVEYHDNVEARDKDGRSSGGDGGFGDQREKDGDENKNDLG